MADQYAIDPNLAANLSEGIRQFLVEQGIDTTQAQASIAWIMLTNILMEEVEDCIGSETDILTASAITSHVGRMLEDHPRMITGALGTRIIQKCKENETLSKN